MKSRYAVARLWPGRERTSSIGVKDARSLGPSSAIQESGRLEELVVRFIMSTINF